MKVRNLILGLAVAFAGFASLGEANAQKRLKRYADCKYYDWLAQHHRFVL